MNQLSWFLYWAGVLPNLATVVIILGIVIILSSLIGFTVLCCIHADSCGNFNPPVWVWVAPSVGVLSSFVLFSAAALVPPTETFYAIAASQVGEAAMKTPLAGKAGEALTAWLDKQIRDAKAPEPKKDATP